MRIERKLRDVLMPAVCAVLLLVGCGRRLPETSVVSGRVTFQGQPIGTGRIVFYPEEGRPAMGVIESDGRYRLTTFQSGDGATLGKHRVTIEAKRVTGEDDAPKKGVQGLLGGDEVVDTAAVAEWLVPEKYSRLETSPLNAEVKPGTNRLDFELTSGTP